MPNDGPLHLLAPGFTRHARKCSWHSNPGAAPTVFVQRCPNAYLNLVKLQAIVYAKEHERHNAAEDNEHGNNVEKSDGNLRSIA